MNSEYIIPAATQAPSKALTSARQRSRQAHRLLTEGRILALLSFVFYGLGTVYLVFHLHYYAGDAASRVANAYYVLFSRNPHLGAIGFVWNPLSSLLELPIVALHPLFPSVVTRGLAGSMVTAVLGSIGVYNFHHIMKGFSVGKPWRIIATLSFALNPFIILYATNGMTDLMWIVCMIGTYSGILDYLTTGSLRRLVTGGFWLAAGFGMRYEAVPFGVLVIVALLIGQWGKKTHDQSQGSAILLGAPIVFAGGLWLYFNWLIMKNPLYFLNSSYGNLAQTSTGAYMTPALARADHHALGALLYVMHFGLLYWPMYLGFIVTLFYCFGTRRDPRALVLIGGTVGAVLLEWVFAYMGHLGAWDRYFISFIPNGILLAVFAAAKVFRNATGASRVRHAVLWSILSLILISGDVGTIIALQNPVLGHSDGQVLDMAFHNQSMQHTLDNPFTRNTPVVQYMNAHPHLSVLADTFVDWPIVVRAQHLNQFIITSDYQFKSILYNPRGRVEAFLVPKPALVAQLDAINRAWPGLWAGKLPWAKLIKSFPGALGYRLYAILPSAP